MKRVNLSKSNGGGSNFESGISSCRQKGFFLSNSWISIAVVSSFEIPPGFRKADNLIDVILCATVSAIPPRTAFVIIIVITARRLESAQQSMLILRHTRSPSIVAVEFGNQPPNNGHLDKENDCMYDRLFCTKRSISTIVLFLPVPTARGFRKTHHSTIDKFAIDCAKKAPSRDFENHDGERPFAGTQSKERSGGFCMIPE